MSVHTRKEQILGVDSTGGAIALDDLGDADRNRGRLKQAKKIQSCKILFHKLAKSLTSTSTIPDSKYLDLNLIATRRVKTLPWNDHYN